MTGPIVQLAVLQVAAFSAMEILERIASHAPVAGIFGHGVFLLGVAVQFLVACAGALVLVWFGRAAERLGRALRGESIGIRGAFVPSWTFGTPLWAHPVVGAWGLRGPPLSR